MGDFNEIAWDAYLASGEYVICFLLARLQAINVRMSEKCGRRVIVAMESRIKSMESIQGKLKRKSLEPTMEHIEGHIHDVFGVRGICLYQDDLYGIVEMLYGFSDIKIRKIKDYIKSPKKSGYRSIHIQMEIPVYMRDAVQWIKVELQLRTVAMNFWAELDHQLRYKKDSEEAAMVAKTLRNYAGVVADFDGKMLELRKQIVTL